MPVIVRGGGGSGGLTQWLQSMNQNVQTSRALAALHQQDQARKERQIAQAFAQTSATLNKLMGYEFEKTLLQQRQQGQMEYARQFGENAVNLETARQIGRMEVEKYKQQQQREKELYDFTYTPEQKVRWDELDREMQFLENEQTLPTTMRPDEIQSRMSEIQREMASIKPRRQLRTRKEPTMDELIASNLKERPDGSVIIRDFRNGVWGLRYTPPKNSESTEDTLKPMSVNKMMDKAEKELHDEMYAQYESSLDPNSMQMPLRPDDPRFTPTPEAINARYQQIKDRENQKLETYLRGQRTVEGIPSLLQRTPSPPDEYRPGSANPLPQPMPAGTQATPQAIPSAPQKPTINPLVNAMFGPSGGVGVQNFGKTAKEGAKNNAPMGSMQNPYSGMAKPGSERDGQHYMIPNPEGGFSIWKWDAETGKYIEVK